MNNRERVLKALNHEEPDRVPVDLGAFSASSVTIEAYRALVEYLGMNINEIMLFGEKDNTVVIDEEILSNFNIDTRTANSGVPYSASRIFENSENAAESYTDCWGIVWKPMATRYALEKGPFSEIKNPSLTDLKSHNWPSPEDLIDYDEEDYERAKQYHEMGKAVVLWLPTRTLSLAQFLRGIDLFLMDCIRNPDFAEGLVAKPIEIELEASRRILAKFSDVVDVVGWSDDLGGSSGPMISPKLYRSMVKPYQKKIVDTIKNNSDARVLLHSDGSVYELISDFIEIGIESLNPVQHNLGNVKNMAPAKLKKEFGDYIAFWGGIDTSRILPFGSIDDVQREVETRIRELGKGGGFVLSTVHNILSEVPPENVVAMLEAATHT